MAQHHPRHHALRARSYVCYLVFQLYTHKDMFDDVAGGDAADDRAATATTPLITTRPAASSTVDNHCGDSGAAPSSSSSRDVESALDSDQSGDVSEVDGPILSATGAISCLAAISVLVAVHSE